MLSMIVFCFFCPSVGEAAWSVCVLSRQGARWGVVPKTSDETPLAPRWSRPLGPPGRSCVDFLLVFVWQRYQPRNDSVSNENCWQLDFEVNWELHVVKIMTCPQKCVSEIFWVCFLATLEHAFRTAGHDHHELRASSRASESIWVGTKNWDAE